MFVYEKKLQYPVKIKNTNPALAKFIISQYGGPDGELGASLRYLSQRYSMPYPELKGMLTDIGTEELGHLEMIGTIVHQLTRNLTPEEIKKAGFEAYFVDHTAGVYPTAASGFPWSAAGMQVKGDVITDLNEDLAAEQKARTTYDNILRLSDDPDERRYPLPPRAGDRPLPALRRGAQTRARKNGLQELLRGQSRVRLSKRAVVGVIPVTAFLKKFGYVLYRGR